MTTVRLIGSYRVDVPEKERRFITEQVTLSEAKTKLEIESLVLLEIEVHSAQNDFDIGLFQQAGSTQAPWLEKYFSIDGEQFLGEDPPNAREFRVCFFLHQFNENAEILSPCGALKSSGITKVPERLLFACKYGHPG